MRCPRPAKAAELLAPAKDLACGLAALSCGADAVYIGAERFGARRAAANPRADIAKLVSRAHLYRAKVYAAVNTLLRDDELEAARRLITGLYEDGVDAVIIQDFGLLDLPPIPFIASTQMHNSSPERVRFLRDAGFQRAILARELSLEEIASIADAAPGIELEAFVHGALCVSYSGRCFLSHALGGRSANRGECAQPCRKPYAVQDAEGRVLARDCHALSLKDLDLSPHLEALLAAGISSFKIEGRLKDADYVKNITLRCRRALDASLAKMGTRKPSSGSVTADFEPEPAKTFNRGATTYFLKGRDPAMHSHRTPKSIGEPAGTVTAMRGDRLELAGAPELHPGDGLCFFGPDGDLRGTSVNKAEDGTIEVDDPRGIAAGTELFRNSDRLWLKRLAAVRIERRIEVSLDLRETPTGLGLRMEDENGVCADSRVACAKSLPKDPEGIRRTMTRQLSKLGDTPFAALEVTLPEAPSFVPVAALNSLRRAAADALVNARLQSHPADERRPPAPDAVYPVSEVGPEENVLNSRAEKFLREHGVRSVQRALDSGPVPRGTRLMLCRYCLRHALGSCGGGEPVPPLYLEDPDGVRLRLDFDCPACRMSVSLKG